MTRDHRSSHAACILTFVVLALAVLPAAWPYFSADIPRTNDAPTHLYRPLALDLALRMGQFWPRWAPDLVHGYGYPIFNFFPPLSHYLVLGYYRAGLGLTTAYRAAVLTHFVLAAWFAYLLARDLFGPIGGWAAALAYVYGPYLLYDAHVRGSLPENQALAILPLLILTLRRAIQHGGRWIAAVAVAFAATFMSHHGLTFQLVIPIGLLVLWLGWREGWRQLWKPITGLALGVLLIAFFWLPVLAEVQYTQSHVAVARGFDYRRYFLTLRDLLAWPRLPADPALFNPPVVRAIPQVALALTALILPWRWRKLSAATRQQIGLWVGVLVICILLVMPVSRPAWDHLPLLKLTLTPFRLLGMATLASALLLAASLADLPISPRHLALLSIAAILLAASSIPWLYPPREPMPEAPTVAHLVAFEIPPLFVGTTTFGEYLPIWVEEMPDTTELRNRLAAGESPDRLMVPEGVMAQRLSGSALDATYRIAAENAATLTYRQFYFPGWRATLDGEPATCHPSHPEGLLLIDVPAGEHTLRIKFGSTWPRTAGWVLSSLGALAIIAILVLPRRQTGTPCSTGQNLPLLWLLALPCLMLTTKLFFDFVNTPLRKSTLGPEGLASVQHPQAVDFAGELRLLGYDQSAERIAADDEVALTLYWRPLRSIGVVYAMVVHIVDEGGASWNSGTFSRPADYRFVPGTDTWPPDGYVMDPRILSLVDGAPPGRYTFQIALVRRDTGQTVASHRVGQLVVTRPARGDRPLEEGMNPAPEAQGWGGLRLLGSRTDRREAAPGDPARVTLLWQVVDPDAANEDQLTLSLLTPDGQEIVLATAPIAGHYAADLWESGDRLRTEILLRLPAHTPDGIHTWQVRVGQAALPIDPLHVHAPERLWEPPPLKIQTAARLGGIATLLGADVQPATTLQPPAAVTVTLAWRAEAEASTSYRVFLHLLGPDGSLVAQSDGEPANWTRPTTGWLPGEIILDERTLQLPDDAPPGEYTLSCGLYDLETGTRLTTADGSDAVRLTTIAVQTP